MRDGGKVELLRARFAAGGLSGGDVLRGVEMVSW